MGNNRTTRFIAGLTTAWFSIGVNVLFTMGSIPLALHYLGKEEFGLWALITQLAGYFGLIDCGMSGAVSRHLIDHKDHKNNGIYGAFIQTGLLVGIIQGILVAIVGSLSGPLFGSIIDIPGKFRQDFQILFAIQCVTLGLGFCFRGFAGMLQAHQRLDVSNIINAVGFLINLLMLWLGFMWGMGLYAMALSGAATLIWTICAQGASIIWLKIHPDRGCWGKPTFAIFWELFGYGKDLFLMSIGWQFLSASQVIIVTRIMGLDAGATWSICTKVYTLVQRFVWQIGDLSYTGFSEMFVRGEHVRLAQRFRDSFVLSGSLGVLVAVVCAACNRSFMTVWTHGQITWAPINDALWCFMFILNNINRSYATTYGMSKRIEFAKWIYLIGGVVFILGACLLGKRIGFAGIIIWSIVVDCMFAGGYGYYRATHFFNINYRTVIVSWPAPCFRFLASYGLIGLFCWWATNGLSPIWKLSITAPFLLSVGLVFLWRLGLTDGLRNDIGSKLRNRFSAFHVALGGDV